MPSPQIIAVRDVKCRAIKQLPGVYPMYQPVIGKIYEGKYRESLSDKGSFCVIPVLDKQIVLRAGEYEIVEDKEDGKR